MAKKLRKQQLKVVFDTNVLFTQVASDLLRAEVADLISQHTEHADLAVTWHLPLVVRDEREYQMAQRASELLPSLEKLERVLGHQLGISDEIVRQRITGIIEKHVASFKLELLPLDIARVDWSRVCKDAVFRKPPFDAGAKEKGFRDAIILESFLQLVEDSPATPKICRLVMLTEDQLLGEAVRARTAERTNVTVFPSVEDLKGFINTLVSNASEEFVAALKKEAASLFWDFEKKEGLYGKWEIQKKIRADFSQQLTVLPAGATSREEGKWVLSPPQFVKKDGRQMHWRSRVTVEVQSYRTEEPKPQASFSLSDLASIAGTSTGPALSTTTTAGASTASTATQGLLAALFASASKVPHKKGKIAFDVAWSVSVNQHRKLRSAELQGVIFVNTLWE